MALWFSFKSAKNVKALVMTNKIEYSIARDFTRKTGLRYREQSENSGQQFREEVLLDLFDKAVESDSILEINLDNTFGYGPSFLEESFGGLARERSPVLALKHLRFISEEEPFLIDEIKDYIQNVEGKN